MEQHPIPQDVTGFQFKLIGTMTVKQFGYVAAGAILAVVSWYAPAPGLWFLLTRLILVPLFGLSGVIIAFVPIEGRPVDVMATNFFHALFSPSQYIYIKKGKKFSFTQIAHTKTAPATKTAQKTTNQPNQRIESKKEQQLRALLAGSYSNVKNNLDKKEMAFLKTIDTIPLASPMPILQTTPLPTNKPSLVPKPITATQPPTPAPQNTLLQQQLSAAREQENSQKKVLTLQGQIQDIHSQKEQVEQELLKLKNQLSGQRPTVAPVAMQQAPVAQAPGQDAAHVHNIPQNMTKSAGLSHVSDTPNVIVGIVKDSRGNMLPNILVEVKDKEGNPVRAFKTNPLGQFASATPLPNGIYTIELEDPKKLHAFDVIQINPNGQIMLPIEVISHDAREELRKALFN